MNAHRLHPINILENLSYFMFLLIIPLIRGILSAFQGSLQSWLRGTWMDILVVGVIIALGVVRWLNCRFIVSDDGFLLKKGLLYKSYTFVPSDNISTITITAPWHYRLFGAVKFRADTVSGAKKKSDIAVSLPNKFVSTFLKQQHTKEEQKYVPDTKYILFLSLLTSNSLAGILLLTTFISNSGKILGDRFADRLYKTYRTIVEILAFKLPPLAAAVAYLIFFGWLVAFAANILRYRNLVITNNHQQMLIHAGFFTVRNHFITLSNISFIDIRQSLLAKILRLYSVFVYAPGSDKEKNDISVVIPASTKKELEKGMQCLFGRFQLPQNQLTPGWQSLSRFILTPIWCFVLNPILYGIAVWLFPDWKQYIQYICFTLFLITLWYFLVHFIDCLSGGVAYDGKTITLRYAKGFHLHTVMIEKEKITAFIIRQSWIQQLMKDRCDIIIMSYGEKRTIHHCKSLPYLETLALFQSENGISE